MRMALAPGPNAFVLQGVDAAGQPISNQVRNMRVTFSGQAQSAAGQVLINEIMYQPNVPDAAFVELYNRSAASSFDLSGWRLKRGRFLIPRGQYY